MNISKDKPFSNWHHNNHLAAAEFTKDLLRKFNITSLPVDVEWIAVKTRYIPNAKSVSHLHRSSQRRNDLPR